MDLYEAVEVFGEFLDKTDYDQLVIVFGPEVAEAMKIVLEAARENAGV